MVHEITDDNFQEEVLGSQTPWVVGFTAGFCTMCKEMEPIFDALSGKFGGEVRFGIVDTDLQRRLRITFAVASWPYVVLVRDGMRTPLFDQKFTEEQLEERVRYVLGGGNAPTFPVKLR